MEGGKRGAIIQRTKGISCTSSVRPANNVSASAPTDAGNDEDDVIIDVVAEEDDDMLLFLLDVTAVRDRFDRLYRCDCRCSNITRR